MSGHPAVLAIDQGTSNTKAVVFDAGGVPRSRAAVDVEPRTGPGGAVELDPRQVLASVVRAGREALRGAGPVDVIAVANQGETVLAWDPDDGRPLSPAIGWQDRRAAALCERWQPAADALRAETGAHPDPYFAAPKLRWLREHGVREGVVTTLDAWLTWQLTGAFATDAATASRTGALELATLQWSPRALATYGLDAERRPAIVDCASMVGTTTAFGAETPVGGLIVDQQASLLGHRCRRPGELKCTIGTGAFLLAVAGPTPPRQRALTVSVASLLGGRATYCVDAQVYAAGAALSWLTRLGLLASAAEVDAACRRAVGERVQFVPALTGWGAPHARPDATACWTGLTATTGPDELVRGVVDGIAAAIADALGAIEDATGVRVPALRVDGGLTGSRALVQRIADLLQRPVEVSHDRDLTCRGLAELGRRALGDPAPELPAPQSTSVDPALAPDAADEALERWRAALNFALSRR